MENDTVTNDTTGKLRTLEAAREYLIELNTRRNNLNLIIRVLCSISCLSGVMYIVIATNYSETLGNITYIALRIFLLLSILPVVLLLTRAPKDTDIRLLNIQNEIDLLNIEFTSLEMRAEKLFKNHQYELEKYYNQTLQHSAWIFIAGIACIGIGVFIVIATLSSLTQIGGMQEMIVTGTVGFLSTVVSNFIGAIYLKMYSETIRSSTEFHNRLVLTHYLHFANFLASKIKDDELREKTLAELTLEITRRENRPSSDSEADSAK